MAKQRARTSRAIRTLELPHPFDPEPQGEAWSFEAGGRVLRLSNLNKVFWPEEGWTKGDLVAVYWNLAERILPYLRDRPLTMVRMPEGIDGHSFYEKQAPDHRPDWVPTAVVPSEERDIDFIAVQDAATLLYVVNLGCIEMHPLHSRVQSIDYPDYTFFDLDPFPPITFDKVRRTALLVREVLDRLGLPSYPRTSGATGMQIYVPLDGSHDYDEARAFVERCCRLIHKAWPQGTTMEWEIRKRSGKVFLDYGMVAPGRNIASLYSVRPRPGMPISTPLRWEEVEGDIEPDDFNVRSIWQRLDREGDLFEPMQAGGTKDGQNLRAAMEAVGLDVSKKKRPSAPAGTPGAAPLEEYKRKRRFDVTSEPAGEVAPERPGDRMFMIHKHHATRLHYDLRLEREGVLVSYAVPKGLPVKPGENRLAVHVEDHPVEYADFTGTIPEGEYGAGEVRIFDAGTYETLDWSDKKVSIVLHGRRVQGEYHLVQTDGKNWLALRAKASGALPLPDPPPRFDPMLATPGGKPFDSRDWLFEVKWDGARTLALFDNGTLRLISRRGRDVTEQYPECQQFADRLAAWNAAVDGEVICLDGSGRPSFERLQQRISLSEPTAKQISANQVDFIAFDLLWLDGESLCDRPIEERRELLEKGLAPGPRLQVSPQIEAAGVRLFEAAKAQGLEGVIAKKRGSRYVPGRRSRDWVKVKAVNRQDCVIIGWEPGQGGRAGHIGSLAVGVYRDGTLTYAGQVGTGFTQRTLAELAETLAPLAVDAPPVTELPPREVADVRSIRWVRPEIVCEVEFIEFTSKHILRAPAFKGLREDKAPEDCLIEEPAG